MMTRFLFIRHASTDALGKYLSGRTGGVYLNDVGKAEAVSLAKRLKTLSINSIYSSPLERTMETAWQIAHNINLAVIAETQLLEIDFGTWTNKPFIELGNDPQFSLFNTFRSNTRVPGGEMMQQAQSRIISFLESLVIKHPDQTLAIVSHSDLIKAALAHYTGIHIDMLQRLEIYPASVSIVEVYQDTARLTLLNHTGDIAW